MTYTSWSWSGSEAMSVRGAAYPHRHSGSANGRRGVIHGQLACRSDDRTKPICDASSVVPDIGVGYGRNRQRGLCGSGEVCARPTPLNPELRLPTTPTVKVAGLPRFTRKLCG